MLRKGQTVRLKDGCDDVYEWAPVGSQGRVKEVNYDSLGYPMAFVEWDKDHWAYNGEKDGWAFQSHFEPVGESMAENDEIEDKIAGLSPEDATKLFAVLKSMGLIDDISDDIEEGDPEPEDTEAYHQLVTSAAAEAEESDAFITMVIKRVEVEGVPSLVPVIFSQSKTQEGLLALEAQMSVLSMHAHQHLINQELLRIRDDKGES